MFFFLFSPVGFSGMLLIFHLLNICCYFSLLVLKGIDFTIGHVLLFSPVGLKGNRFHYWTFFVIFPCWFFGDASDLPFAEYLLLFFPVGFKGNRFHYWTCSVIFPCWFKRESISLLDIFCDFPLLVLKGCY